MLASIFCDMAAEFCDAMSDAVRGAADAYLYPAASRHYCPRPAWADGRRWYPIFEEVEMYLEQVVGPTLKKYMAASSYYMDAWLNLGRVHASAQGSLAYADRYGDWREIRDEADNMRSVLMRMIDLAIRMLSDLEKGDMRLIYEFRPIKDRLEYYKAQLDR